ncbi:MAG: AMP-binding protein, partial [Candidatus Babeliales bacterium]
MIAGLRNFFKEKTEQEKFDEHYKTLFLQGRMIFAGTLLQRAAKAYPENVALICRNVSITYKDLYAKAICISKKLMSMGVQPGDRIIVLIENSLEFYMAYYGAWQTGAVVAPLNTFLHEQELNHIIQDAQPKAMIISNSFAERLQQFDGKHLPPYFTENDFEKIFAEPCDVTNFVIPERPAEEMAALLYTSGTTGFPKGVMLSSKNILTNIVQGICRADIVPTDRIYAALPLFHSFAEFACVWGSFFLGGTTIVIPRIDRRYLMEGFTHKPTIVAGVPALYGL